MSAATLQQDQLAPYRQPVDAVLAALGTDARLGLSQREARARLERYGKNELMAEKPVPAWRKFLAQFHDVLVILLLIATVISAGLWLVERDSALPYEAIAILAVVLLNAVMGYIQRSRAEQAVAALRQMSATCGRVPATGVSCGCCRSAPLRAGWYLSHSRDGEEKRTDTCQRPIWTN